MRPLLANWRITHDTRRAGRLPAVVGAKHCIECALAPGASVGRTESVHCVAVPVALTCEIVREAVPEFVIVKACDFVCPLMTLPKLKLAGLTVNPACTPVPDNAIVAGEPAALLVTVTLPLALPLAVGV